MSVHIPLWYIVHFLFVYYCLFELGSLYNLKNYSVQIQVEQLSPIFQGSRTRLITP